MEAQNKITGTHNIEGEWIREKMRARSEMFATKEVDIESSDYRNTAYYRHLPPILK